MSILVNNKFILAPSAPKNGIKTNAPKKPIIENLNVIFLYSLSFLLIKSLFTPYV